LTTLQQVVEVGYIVLNDAKEPIGVVGFVDPDPASQVIWLDGHCHRNSQDALEHLRAAVPVVLDEAERSGNIRHVYYEEYVELNESLISDHQHLWIRELEIPEYAHIDGIWCSRRTYRLDMSTWGDR
jgi:hypothetical protein